MRRRSTLLEVIMNRTYLALSLAVLAAGYACAGEITVDPEPFVSVASRAQVQEELRQYRAAGINPWANNYDQLAAFHSTLSRDLVKAEFMAWRDEAAAFSSEDSGSSYLARSAPAMHRGTDLAHAE